MTDLVAVLGRAAIRPKMSASTMLVAESASQSTLSEFPAKAGRFELATAEEILLKAAACNIAPIASKSAANNTSNRGADLAIHLQSLRFYTIERLGCSHFTN